MSAKEWIESARSATLADATDNRAFEMLKAKRVTAESFAAFSPFLKIVPFSLILLTHIEWLSECLSERERFGSLQSPNCASGLFF